MEVIVKISTEVRGDEWKEITRGFNLSFDRKYPVDHFKNYYSRTRLGYSYLALVYNEEGRVIASNAILPIEYLVSGEKMLFGLSGGTFVLKEYRKDPFIFMDMIKELSNTCKDKLVAIYGVSNENSFDYAIKILKETHLMDLDIYVFPLSPLRNTKYFFMLDPIFRIVSLSNLYIQKLLFTILPDSYANSDIFVNLDDKHIANRFYNNYKVIRDSNFRIIYKIYEEDGRQVCYLFDYTLNGKKSYRALLRSILYLVQNEKMDLIVYIGSSVHKQYVMAKVPKRYKPHRFPVTYRSLLSDNGSFNQLIQNSKWDFNLTNFDVR